MATDEVEEILGDLRRMREAFSGSGEPSGEPHSGRRSAFSPGIEVPALQWRVADGGPLAAA